MFISFSVHEIPALGLSWGFITKVTVTYHIPTSFLADAVSDLSTVPIRNTKIAFILKFLCLEPELQKCLACMTSRSCQWKLCFKMKKYGYCLLI